MSEHEDLNPFEDPPAVEDESFPPDPVDDDGWSPVMGTPPPDADLADAEETGPAPHEVSDTTTPPPGSPDPSGELGEAPPPPPAGELPPDLPDPVDLSVEGGDHGAPMPPVTGDTATAPPTGDVDLSDGPPVAPQTGGPTGDQSPVPQMGDTPTDGAPMPPVTGDTTTAPPTGDVDLSDGPPVAPQTGGPTGDQSPVPQMGDTPTDGAPMPPVTGDTTTAPPTGDVDLSDGPPVAPTVGATPTGDQSPVPTMGDTPATGDTGDAAVVEGVPVAPGEERLTAAAVTGWFMDEVDADDPARERMIDLVEQAALDGTITVDELALAFEQAGFPTEATDGSDTALDAVLAAPAAQPRSALVSIDGEGLGLFRVTDHGDVIELESVRSGAVYAADRADVGQAWRDSGSRIISTTTTTETIVPPDLDDKPVKPKQKDDGDDGSSTVGNLLLAGGVLLPLAGGATYLATRKLR